MLRFQHMLLLAGFATCGVLVAFAICAVPETAPSKSKQVDSRIESKINRLRKENAKLNDEITTLSLTRENLLTPSKLALAEARQSKAAAKLVLGEKDTACAATVALPLSTCSSLDVDLTHVKKANEALEKALEKASVARDNELKAHEALEKANEARSQKFPTCSQPDLDNAAPASDTKKQRPQPRLPSLSNLDQALQMSQTLPMWRMFRLKVPAAKLTWLHLFVSPHTCHSDSCGMEEGGKVIFQEFRTAARYLYELIIEGTPIDAKSPKFQRWWTQQKSVASFKQFSSDGNSWNFTEMKQWYEAMLLTELPISIFVYDSSIPHITQSMPLSDNPTLFRLAMRHTI